MNLHFPNNRYSKRKSTTIEPLLSHYFNEISLSVELGKLDFRNVIFWVAEEFKMAIRDLAPCLLFRWLWVIIAGQQQKGRSWRASVECSRPVGEKNNSEGGKGEGSRAMEEGLGNQEIIVVWKHLKTKIYFLLWHVTTPKLYHHLSLLG